MNSEQLKVSIIITCYNLEQFIKEAVTSLLNQQCDFDYEIILVDDCSTDNSLQRIKEIASPKIKMIANDKNLGAAESVTMALGHCQGEYICRFDGDDVWPPYYLKTAAAVLDTHPDVNMIYTDVSFIDKNGNVTSKANNINRKNKKQPVLDDEFANILKEHYINAPTIMFRHKAFAAAFPLPKEIAEKRNFIDWYITLCVLQNGKAYFIDEPLAFYRIHTTNNHRLIIVNKIYEEVTEFILDKFVKNNKTISKSKKRSILAHGYLIMAENYFGINMLSDAKRYYLKGLANNPTYILKKDFIKHFTGTLVGVKVYQNTKSLVHKIKIAKSLN